MPSLTPADVAPAVRGHDDGATVALRVVPRAPRTEITGRHGDALRLKVHAAPVEGAANAEVLAHIAACCKVRTRDVELLSGERSRQKVVLVRGLDPDQVVAALTSA